MYLVKSDFKILWPPSPGWDIFRTKLAEEIAKFSKALAKVNGSVRGSTCSSKRISHLWTNKSTYFKSHSTLADIRIYGTPLDPHHEICMEESTSSGGEEGWRNDPIRQTNGAQCTYMISLAWCSRSTYFLGQSLLEGMPTGVPTEVLDGLKGMCHQYKMGKKWYSWIGLS